MSEVTIALPSEVYQESFFAAMEEFRDEGGPQIPDSVTPATFAAYIGRLQDQAAGRNLKEGYVPSMEWWIVDADGFAGRIILGLNYYPSPERFGHHVGYAVRPSRRRRGYATHALRMLLEQARQRGITRLMPTCGANNVASRRVIEANGGILLNPNAGDCELRFLIDLAPVI